MQRLVRAMGLDLVLGLRPLESAIQLRPRDLLAALHGEDVEFVVIGGMSLAVHGYVRATKDLDVVPSQDRDDLRRLVAALRAMDARVDLGDPDTGELGLEPDEDGLSGGGNGALTTTFGRLDVMQKDVPGLRDYDHRRGGAVEIDGTLYAGYDEVLSRARGVRPPLSAAPHRAPSAPSRTPPADRPSSTRTPRSAARTP